MSLFHLSKKKAVVIIAIASLGGIAYLGLDFWIKRNLPAIIEAQGSKLLNRPVQVGKVANFSLTAITLNSVSVPATPTEQDKVAIDAVRVGINLFPLIFRRTIAVDLSLISPKIYLEQAADNSWLNIDLPQKEGGNPLYLDLVAKIEEGDIQIVPYNKSPFNIELDGEGRYNPQNKGQITYNIETKIAKALASLQGETLLETGSTTAKLGIKDLALTNLVNLIPNAPVNLTQGLVNADLNLNIPSLKKFTNASIEGILRVGEVRGEIASRQIAGKSRLKFWENKVEVQQTQASIENITATVSGAIDLQQGYDLDLAILPFDLARLPQTLALKLPVPVTGEIEGNIQLRGDIEQPRLSGKINNTKPIAIDKQSLKTVSANFSSDLNKFTLQDFRIIPEVGGIVKVTGEIATNISENLANNQVIDFRKMPLDFTLEANLPSQAIADDYFQLSDKISVGNLSSKGKVTGTIADPQLLLQWNMIEARIAGEAIQGQGNIAFAQEKLLLQDTFLEVGTGKIEIKGIGDTEEKTWQTQISSNNLNLTPFLSQLPLEGININYPISVNNAQANFSGKLDELSPEKIQGLASVDLDLNNNSVTLNSSLNQGTVSATVNTETIILNQIISNLTTPVTIQSSKLDVSAQIKSLLTKKPDLSSLNTKINANLLVAEGIVTAEGSLTNNQWQGKLQGNNLKPALLSTQIPDKLDPIDTNIQVSGNVQSLIAQQDIISLKVDQIEITMGQQYLNATGDIALSNLLTNPDIANLALDIDSRLDFNNLYLQEIYLKNNPQSLVNIPNISGQAEFTGKLQGKNLISNPTQPGNIFLTSDITLKNLTVQDTVFEPVMKGSINIDSNAKIAVVIQGEQDLIAAKVEPCRVSQCRFPYLPTDLNLRINNNQNTSIMVTGNRQEDIFQVEIAQFPLAVLNITPAKSIELEDPLKGIITGDLGINLFSLGTSGNITVKKPGIEYLEADKFAVNFNYDPKGNLAEITTASLILKDSEYNLNGKIDLSSGKIQGKLNIPQAYIQNILTTLGWYSIADAIDLWDYVEFASADSLELNNIKTIGKSIDYKLQLLTNIEQKFQEIIAAQINSNLPTQLDITGAYSGEVLIAGNIDNPEINFAINAENWQWKTQKTITTSIPDQGVVKLNAQVVAIPQIQLKGNYKEQNLNLDLAKLQLEDAIFSTSGTFSPDRQDVKFEVNNLSTDAIAKLVRIPLDITGIINTNGTFKGTIDQPELVGNIVFIDGVFNQEELGENIVGDYNYQNQKLNFNITSPESIQIAATIPYPIQPQVNDQVKADIKLTTEAFTLLDALTQNNLTWIGGEATAEIVATANIDLNKAELFDNLEAQGKVALDQVQIKTPLIAETLTATGNLTLNNQLVEVETIQAKIGEKDLSVAGKFPLLDAVSDLDNPLTIKIPQGNILLKELYKGEIGGNIIVTGTAIEPILSGEVALENGKLSIPKTLLEQDPAIPKTTNPNPSPNSPSRFQLLTKDFLLRLDKFRLAEQSLFELGLLQPIDIYGFKLEGEVSLNGPLNDISQLRGNGKIKLLSGSVGWITSNFLVVRDRDNLIVFNPDTDIINPNLDIELKADVEELRQTRQLEPGTNEIFDDILQANRIRKIDVRMNIKGTVEELLGLTEQLKSCDISPDNVAITGNSNYSNTALDELDSCVRSEHSFIESPAVTLSSTPYRSQGEIINLLGYQALLIDPNSRNNSILDLAFGQFIYKPLERRFLFEAEDFFVRVGKNFGIDYFRVFPFVEATSKLGNSNFYIRGIYDYNVVRPQNTSTDANNNRQVYEIRLEYRLNF